MKNTSRLCPHFRSPMGESTSDQWNPHTKDQQCEKRLSCISRVEHVNLCVFNITERQIIHISDHMWASWDFAWLATLIVCSTSHIGKMKQKKNPNYWSSTRRTHWWSKVSPYKRTAVRKTWLHTTDPLRGKATGDLRNIHTRAINAKNYSSCSSRILRSSDDFLSLATSKCIRQPENMKENNKAPSAFLILCGGIHGWPMASPHKRPAMRKSFMQFLENTAAFVSSILWKEIVCTAVTTREHHGISFDWQLYCFPTTYTRKTVEQDIKIPHYWSSMRRTQWWPMGLQYTKGQQCENINPVISRLQVYLCSSTSCKNKFSTKVTSHGRQGISSSLETLLFVQQPV